MANISQIQIPVTVNGEEVLTTFDIKDAWAREMIAALGNAVYWIGVTTTALTDGSTTNPITVNGETVTANVGGMAQYDGEEFVWSGSAWQSMGKNNFGELAFANSVQATYTPQGTVSQPTATVTGGTTTTVNSITNVGTLPSMSVSGEVLSFDAGTLPTKGVDTTVVNSVGTIEVSQPIFTGTTATITSTKPQE